MRSGRLKTRRYKVRGGGGAALFLALVCALGLFFAIRQGIISFPAPLIAARPESSLKESETAEKTVTLPGQAWYALQLGSFDSRENAAALAASYQGRGAGGYVFFKGSYRVLAAAYDTRADAQAVGNQLKTQHQVDAEIVEILWPEMTLRLTGKSDQLTALNDAFDAAAGLAGRLSALSHAIDHREADAAQARAALQSERDTARALQARLISLFGGAPHPAASDMASFLGDLSAALDAAQAAQGNTALSAQVKYAQLCCLCRMAEYLGALAQ